MTNLERIQAKARELARSGKFYGWRPIAFELRFQEGYKEAREWLHDAATEDELDRLCQLLAKPRTGPLELKFPLNWLLH